MGIERSVNIRYSFVPMGSIVSEDSPDEQLRPKRNRIFLDVGNDLGVGIVDHHHMLEGLTVENRVYNSTTCLVYLCPGFITQNIDANAHEVEFVMHRNLDFDCFASAFLAGELVRSRGFTDEHRMLAEYADEIDSGRMRLNSATLRAPFAVACAIDEIVKKEYERDYDELEAMEKARGCKLPDRRNELDGLVMQDTMKRGLELAGYIIARLMQLDGVQKSLYHPAVLQAPCPFEPELAFIKQDYKKYLYDIDEKNGICEKTKMRLPQIRDRNGFLREVDALFWSKAPSCILHKYWARQDESSPEGGGYVMTFIPYPYRKCVIDKKTCVFEGREVELSKVIISVDPNSGVCLKGLAEQLEEAELAAEKNILQGMHTRKRDFGRKRFSDPWCTNSDPWYDGRNFDYTIVDAPSSGSVLTVEEIRKITLNFTRPRVTENTIRIAIPFNYAQSSYEKLAGLFRQPLGNGFETARINYFIPYIQSYMFGSGLNFESQYCRHFSLKSSFKDKTYIWAEEDTGKTGLDQSMPEVGKQRIRAEIRDANLIIFRYCAGFVLIDVEVKPGCRVLVDDVLAFNSCLSGCSTIEEEILKLVDANTKGFWAEIEKWDKCLLYTAVEISPDTFFEAHKREMVYKLCSGLKWDELFTSCVYVDTIVERMFFDIGRFAFYGMSKSGGALVVVPDRAKEKECGITTDRIWEAFFSTDFDIFLLALHQRNSLIYFSSKLAEYGKKNMKTEIEKLRLTLLEFITQGWFSQITNNEIGVEIYRRWHCIFENEKLYEECSNQLATVDDFNKARLTHYFGVLSVITFPLVIISSLIQVGLVRIEELASLGSAGWAAVAVLLGFCVYIIKKLLLK